MKILFKGISLDTGNWVEGDLVHTIKEVDGATSKHTLIGKNLQLEEVKPETVCQLVVELGDTLMWENDILISKWGKFVIRRSQIDLYLAPIGSKSIVPMDKVVTHKDTKVVGSIFEQK